MKLRVDPKLLADAAGTAAKALPSRPSVPVLAGVMLRAVGGDLEVSSFDYERSNQITVGAVVASDGAALVSGRLLSEITKALPPKPVDIAAVGAHLELVCGTGRFTLPTMPVEDYPQLPGMPDPAGELDAALFATAVAQTAVAAGRDETLPMMTGVRVEFGDDTLSLLATDRYRLVVRELPFTPADGMAGLNLLVPAATLADTAKTFGPLGGQVTLNVRGDHQGEGMFGLSVAGRRMTTRLLVGDNYPPVRSLFPKPDDVNAQAVVPVAKLAEVVKRVALVAERTTPVLLTFTDGEPLMVEAGGTEEARASEALDDITFTGQPITIGFNPQYLLDALTTMGTVTAHISFVDGNKPAVISPAHGDGHPSTDHRYLIMPIRVSR